LLKLVAGLLPTSEGAVFVREGAEIGSMIELGVGFHPELTGVENLHLSASLHGLSRAAIDAMIPEIVRYSGLANFMDQPLKHFSSGMTMRLGFALSANLRPDLLLIDEVFAVGDTDFQARCKVTMREVRQRGCTVLFVSHATAAIREICSRVIVLEAGQAVFDGDVDEGLTHYARLMASGTVSALPGAASRGGAGAASRWHRRAVSPHWDAIGPWAGALLQREGLEPHHFLLDVGCGSLPVALHVMPGMAPGRYWGIESDKDLVDAGVREELGPAGVLADRGHVLLSATFDLASCPHRFPLALIHSLASRTTATEFSVAVTAAVNQLAPTGRLLVAVPAGRPEHREAVLGLAGLDLVVEPVLDAAHPDGDDVFRVTLGPVGAPAEHGAGGG
jgi:ABC-type polysaccharide/polyol phosphate transport system ATPase subunit